MTQDRLNKREIRVLQQETGLPYMEARRLLIAFAYVLDQEPALSANGFGLPDYGRRTLAERREQFQDFRGRLERSAIRVIEVHLWLLENIRPIKTPGYSSYGMKHVFEDATGQYVTNGEFIAAAMMAGYPMRRIDGPNAAFGMSKRDVDRVQASTRA